MQSDNFVIIVLIILAIISILLSWSNERAFLERMANMPEGPEKEEAIRAHYHYSRFYPDEDI